MLTLTLPLCRTGGQCAVCVTGTFKPGRADWAAQCTPCAACESGQARWGCGGLSEGVCLACGKPPTEPALCLLCGALLCGGPSCPAWKRPLDGQREGECTRHARSCGLGVGMFALVHQCTTLLVAALKRGVDDINSMWTVYGGLGSPCVRGRAISSGTVIRLRHAATGRWLHSHQAFNSPLSNNQEVSAFGDDEETDDADNWKVVVDGGEFTTETLQALSSKDVRGESAIARAGTGWQTVRGIVRSVWRDQALPVLCRSGRSSATSRKTRRAGRARTASSLPRSCTPRSQTPIGSRLFGLRVEALGNSHRRFKCAMLPRTFLPWPLGLEVR